MELTTGKEKDLWALLSTFFGECGKLTPDPEPQDVVERELWQGAQPATRPDAQMGDSGARAAGDEGGEAAGGAGDGGNGGQKPSPPGQAIGGQKPAAPSQAMTAADTRADMDAVRERLEGPLTGEARDKLHARLTAEFKRTAVELGADKPSTLPADMRPQFRALINRLRVNDRGELNRGDLPF